MPLRKVDVDEYLKSTIEAVKILDIRVKNHKNSSNNYQSIPRSTYEPETEDTDGL